MADIRLAGIIVVNLASLNVSLAQTVSTSDPLTASPAGNVKLPTYLSPNEVILHRGQTQHIRCPSYNNNERLRHVIWFKGEQLLTRYTDRKVDSSYASSDRYRMSHSHDLIISHVDMRDQGEYVCSVVSSATALERRQTISVTVLTDVPSFKEAMDLTAGEVYVHRNQTHHIQCPSYREEESVSLVFWFKGSQLIARYANPEVGTNFISSRHYWMSSSYGLVINQVQAADEGDYVCGVVPSATGVQRKGSVRVTVSGPTFPIVDNAQVVNILEKGQGHVKLTCPVLRMHKQAATVYWSLGSGDTMRTSIIGVKFSGGGIMVADDYRGDYNITVGGSLVLNTLDMPTSRVWCHVFLHHQEMSSAYYDVIETAKLPDGSAVQSVVPVVCALITAIGVIIGICICVKRRNRNIYEAVRRENQDESEANQSIMPREPASVATKWTEEGGVVTVTVLQAGVKLSSGNHLQLITVTLTFDLLAPDQIPTYLYQQGQ
ncbi:uncharacterized protein LOC119728886 [Patiria miniata]|uniref:Ig-like domain-containing protein n=1 Tax=Patiria miniata TaxID=46514 RepID=A0A914A077_PATMI|nr:uncharacterized protein LOC119728886 [Patiria miniata]